MCIKVKILWFYTLHFPHRESFSVLFLPIWTQEAMGKIISLRNRHQQR
jgi:hypothetical protein